MKLSILIPTYNRCTYLKCNLDNLLPQLYDYKDEVELWISDNCSSDKTKEIIYEYKQSSSIEINYIRNNENIGGLKNTLQLVEKARGEYLFVMGDDDVLSPNFMDIIMSSLKGNKHYGIVHWNRLSGDSNCNNCYVVDQSFHDSTWEGCPSSFILRLLDKPNFLSSVIFNKRCWELGEPYAKNDYIGYIWFARVYWGALLLNFNCVYYYFPLVVQRNPSKTWMLFWPQYYFSSLSNIFMDLENKIPGVYVRWRQEMEINVDKNLLGVLPYKNYYRQPSIKANIQKHLSVTRRIMMNIYLYFPFSYTIYRVYNRLSRCINK